MSYKPYFPEDTDTLSVMFSLINDCLTICKKMYDNRENKTAFLKLYSKARRIDPRTTYIFIKDRYDEFPYNRYFEPFFSRMSGRYPTPNGKSICQSQMPPSGRYHNG